MARDPGAMEIRGLLTRPDKPLGLAFHRFVTALARHGVARSGKLPTIPQPARSALADLRREYRQLHASIARIETTNAVDKRRALEGLQLLDSSFGLFLESSGAANATRMAELVREAYWQREHAYAKLTRAVKSLA